MACMLTTCGWLPIALQNKAALFGGGVLGQLALFNATRTSISFNRAVYGGGGVKLLSGTGLFRNCELRGNRATYGGALEVRFPHSRLCRNLCCGTADRKTQNGSRPLGLGSGVVVVVERLAAMTSMCWRYRRVPSPQLTSQLKFLSHPLALQVMIIQDDQVPGASATPTILSVNVRCACLRLAS